MSDRRTLEIDPTQKILMGEDAGRKARADLGLDELDGTSDTATVRISTPVVTSSFIQGLVGGSILVLGRQAFEAKYQFDASPPVRESIFASVRRVLGSAS